jgi:hypothetical protein
MIKLKNGDSFKINNFDSHLTQITDILDVSDQINFENINNNDLPFSSIDHNNNANNNGQFNNSNRLMYSQETLNHLDIPIVTELSPWYRTNNENDNDFLLNTDNSDSLIEESSEDVLARMNSLKENFRIKLYEPFKDNLSSSIEKKLVTLFNTFNKNQSTLNNELNSYQLSKITNEKKNELCQMMRSIAERICKETITVCDQFSLDYINNNSSPTSNSNLPSSNNKLSVVLNKKGYKFLGVPLQVITLLNIRLIITKF